MKSGRQTNAGSLAVGIDCTCIEMYKATIDTCIVLPYIKIILSNRILNCCNFPEEWKPHCTGAKKGCRADPNNYRAISFANSSSKIFIKVLSNLLTCWTENICIINQAQAGFYGTPWLSYIDIKDNVLLLCELVKLSCSEYILPCLRVV